MFPPVQKGMIAILLGIFFPVLAAELKSEGEILMEGIRFQVRFFTKEWKGYFPKAWKYEHGNSGKENETMFCRISIPGHPDGTLILSRQRNERKTDRFFLKTDFLREAELNEIALCAELPVARYRGAFLMADGKKIVFPETFQGKSGTTLFSGTVRELIVPGELGAAVLRGPLKILVQDSRRYGKEYFFLRIAFDGGRGRVRHSELAFELREKKYQFTSLDLRSIVNMGFADSYADDGRGGWTDQGPESDLHEISPGRQRFQGVVFDIIDPKKNQGKSCLMLAGRQRPMFPEKALCPVPRDLQANYLYLLHATAWTENNLVGTVRVEYEDGTVSEIPVVGNRDVGNWKEPLNLPSSDVVWRVGEGRASAGLYQTCFPLKRKKIRTVEFLSDRNSVWGIVAASFSDACILRKRDVPLFIGRGSDRIRMEDCGDVESGSVLDFSRFLDAPAGKYGPVRIRNSRFVFRDRPGRPVRFYGTNLCSDTTVPDKKWAEIIAERIARLGFNIVRLHHHDKLITNWRKNTTELDSGMLDRMDYLVYCLKQRGIYLTTDFFAARSEFMPAGEIPGYPGKFLSLADYKALFYISDAVFENWKAFCRNWIRHINPYTGLSMKDDPAYVAFVLVNEGNLNDVQRYASGRNVREYFQKCFQEWMKHHHPGEKAAAENSDPRFTRFLLELYRRRYAQMVEFIRSEGIQAPLTDQNMRSSPALTLMRGSYDFVDNHCYWTRIRFLGKGWGALPSLDLRPHSLLKEYAKLPGDLFASRIFGNPFTVTEFDSSLPNEFRVEAPPVTAAYAALQDWSMLCQFAYSHRMARIRNPNDTANYFDLVNDPLKRLANQLAARLFLDGGVEAASPAFAIVVPGIEGLSFQNTYPGELVRLGLIARLGSVTGTPGKLPQGCRALLTVGGKRFSGLPLPQYPLKDSAPDLLETLKRDGLLPENSFSEKNGVYRSATGQIELNAKQETFKLVSPFCELLILPEGTDGTSGNMTVRNRKGRALFALLSIDGQKIGDSRHLLLFHLTSALPSMMKFSDSKKNRLDAWGQAPWLATKGEAVLRLNLPGAETWRIYSLTAAGKRVDRCGLQKNSAGEFLLPIRNSHPSGCIPVYELIR